jgi:hypothetical protein
MGAVKANFPFPAHRFHKKLEGGSEYPANVLANSQLMYGETGSLTEAR